MGGAGDTKLDQVPSVPVRHGQLDTSLVRGRWAGLRSLCAQEAPEHGEGGEGPLGCFMVELMFSQHLKARLRKTI